MRWLLLIVALLLAAESTAAKLQLNAKVAAQKWSTLRLKGLPKDGSLAIRVETSGPIDVIFLHETELRRFPDAVRPAFAGSAEHRLSFRVTVPFAGTYYVILDNRKGEQARDVRLFIEALPARRPQKPAVRPKPDGNAI